MEKKIILGNVKIAKFVGMKSTLEGWIWLDEYNQMRIENLKYHSSWDWLMPVWDKLTTALRDSMPTDRYFHQLNRFENKIHACDIKGCFEIIVENIDWYNNHVSKENKQ